MLSAIKYSQFKKKTSFELSESILFEDWENLNFIQFIYSFIGSILKTGDVEGKTDQEADEKGNHNELFPLYCC